MSVRTNNWEKRQKAYDKQRYGMKTSGSSVKMLGELQERRARGEETASSRKQAKQKLASSRKAERKALRRK